jgi:hypothetical protein
LNNPFETIPIHWQDWLKEYSIKTTGGKRDRLSAEDFNGSVKIKYSDGTFLLFEYAFYAVNEEAEEIAVFTEHCGYHVFPLNEAVEYSYNIWAESPGDPMSDYVDSE